MHLSKHTIIGELLDHDPSRQLIFERYDMHCFDCPSARGETLEEACNIHGVELETLLRALDTH